MLSTSQLHYNAAINLFTADISMLEHNGFRWEQAYPDSVDLGVTLVSHNTGKEIPMVVDYEEWGGEDLLAWRLKPVKKYNDPRIDDMRVVIYND